MIYLLFNLKTFIMLNKKRILSINVSNGSQNDFVDEIFSYSSRKQSSYVCFANVHMLVEAHTSPTLSNVINSADIVAPDGLPVAKSFDFIYGIKQQRIDGTSIMKRVLLECQSNHKKVFFYGGTQDMLDKAAIYLKTKYNGLNIAGMFAPPFRALVQQEKESVIERIKKSDADFVFVVLGCPKQEAWMHEMKHKLPCVMLGIGGALPMILGIYKRAPIWLQKIGMEWFFRLCQEPQRLFQRYAITNTKFLWLLASELFNKQFHLKPRIT
jgi:N-acetylglucosaminyldiphosphoundecaprenol N-acetyl-beta-D-mannosaminyltransferase